MMIETGYGAQGLSQIGNTQALEKTQTTARTETVHSAGAAPLG